MVALNGQDTQDLIEIIDTDFIVHMGTVSAYSKPVTYPVHEYQPLGVWFAGDYGKGKAECEHVLSSSGLAHAVLRPSYVLGANNYSPRESFIYSHILEGKALKIPGYGEALNQFVFADEVAKSLYTLGKQRAEGSYNCVGNEAISLADLVRQMAKIATGNEAVLIDYEPSHDKENWDRASFPFANMNMVFDNSKIKSLGIVFAPLLERLAQDWQTYYSKSVGSK